MYFGIFYNKVYILIIPYIILHTKIMVIIMSNINQLINVTKDYLRKYDYESVIKYCDKILEIDYHSGFALKFKGVSYLQMGMYDKAITYYERLYQLDFNSFDTIYDLAYLNEKIANYPEALIYYDKINANGDVENERRRLLSKMKAYDLIITEYDEKLDSISSQNDEENIIKEKIALLQEKAVFLYRNNEYEKSYDTFKEVSLLYKKISDTIFYKKDEFDRWYDMLSDYLAKYSNYEDFFNSFFNLNENKSIWYGRLSCKLSKYEDLLVFGDLLLEYNPDNIELLSICGKNSTYLNDEYALTCWHKILELDPENVDAIYKILNIYYHHYSSDKSLKLIDSKLYIKDIKPELLSHKINILESMTLYDDAIKTYDEYLSMENHDTLINNRKTVFDKLRCMEKKALCLYNEKKYHESYSCFKEISVIFQNIEDGSIKIHYSESATMEWYKKILKKCLEASGDNPEIFFKEYYNLDTESIEIWIKRMESLLSYKEIINPISYCNILIEKNPDNMEILLLKADLCYYTKRLEEALETYEKLLEKKEDNHVQKRIFNILVDKHQFTKAYNILVHAEIGNDYDTDKHMEKLANAFIHYKKYDKAKHCLTHILKDHADNKIITLLKHIWDITDDVKSQKESPYYMDWIDLINFKHEKHVCPKCGNKLIPIIYGLVAFDEEERSKIGKEYVLGGCMVSEDSPHDYCTHCKKAVYMGVYDIDIISEDSDLARYTGGQIKYIRRLIEENPLKSIEDIKKQSYMDLSMDANEFAKFIEKLEEIGFIKKDSDKLKVIKKHHKK